jgi:hypothetical protein
MMKKYPELNYVPDGPPNNPQRHLYWRFFDCIVDPDSGSQSTMRLAAAGTTSAARCMSTCNAS